MVPPGYSTQTAPYFPSLDTTDGAPLYPGGVQYVDERPHNWILGTVVLLLNTLGGVGLGRGGGGSAVLWGLVGLGAETAFIGRAVVVVGRGDYLLRGIAASSLSELDPKANRAFRFFEGGWGGLGCGLAGLNWSGVDPPLSSTRACLTTFIAISLP